jgi:hypothetical protein
MQSPPSVMTLPTRYPRMSKEVFESQTDIRSSSRMSMEKRGEGRCSSYQDRQLVVQAVLMVCGSRNQLRSHCVGRFSKTF